VVFIPRFAHGKAALEDKYEEDKIYREDRGYQKIVEMLLDKKHFQHYFEEFYSQCQQVKKNLQGSNPLIFGGASEKPLICCSKDCWMHGLSLQL
jgi:hypothetical protein